MTDRVAESDAVQYRTNEGVVVEVDVQSDAFRIGIEDGLESPFDLGMGMTWADNQDKNEWYDTGVNVGQNLMRLLLGGV